MSGAPFPNSSMGAQQGFYQSSYAPAPSSGATMDNNDQQYYMPPPMQSATSFEDEPPLLEELGINVSAVIAKLRTVANPLSNIDSTFSDEADMTGPVTLCLLLGFLLLFQAKVQFGAIYGQAIGGCIAVYFLFNLMSERGIDLYRSTSILGYSLLPMVILSFFAIFKSLKTMRVFTIILGGGCIFWSTTTATKIFVAVLALNNQFWLVWYPLALLYTSFAFITVF